MDIQALQARLRHFAAERDWQPYHAPKNLAMALMVEVAELAELFQWTTLTESRGLTRDPVRKVQVADEIADVLLYLVQLADHTGVDVEDAVLAKLRKNAEKYPATRAVVVPPTSPPRPSAAPPTSRVHLLVDWENVQPTADALRALVREATDVWIFHGPHQKVEDANHGAVFGREAVTRVPRSGAGRNALDFQLSYYVGYISARQPDATFVIVSNDQGYDPMLEHARQLGFDARRCDVPRPAAAKSLLPSSTPSVPPPRAVGTGAPSEPAVACGVNVASALAGFSAQMPAVFAGGGGAVAVHKASKTDMEQVFQALRKLPVTQRPDSRSALIAFIQQALGGAKASAAQCAHALAQLQSQRWVCMRGEGVSYPATTANARKSTANAPAGAKTQKKSPTATPARPPTAASLKVATLTKSAKSASLPKSGGSQGSKKPDAAAGTAAPETLARVRTPQQVAQAVVASLSKMPRNKPTRPAGLLNFIETHAAKAPDPHSMARQVCALLEARKLLAIAPGGGVSYPGLKAKSTASL